MYSQVMVALKLQCAHILLKLKLQSNAETF